MDKKWEVGYKLLVKDEGRLYSFNQGERHEGCLDSVRYRTNKSTVPYPDCGPLAVFSTLESGMREIDHFAAKVSPEKEFVLYKCKYIQSAKKGLWIDKTNVWLLKDIRKRFPETVLADEVIITRKVS